MGGIEVDQIGVANREIQRGLIQSADRPQIFQSCDFGFLQAEARYIRILPGDGIWLLGDHRVFSNLDRDEKMIKKWTKIKVSKTSFQVG